MKTYEWQKDAAFVDWVAKKEEVSRDEALLFRQGMQASHEAWVAGRSPLLRGITEGINLNVKRAIREGKRVSSATDDTLKRKFHAERWSTLARVDALWEALKANTFESGDDLHVKYRTVKAAMTPLHSLYSNPQMLPTSPQEEDFRKAEADLETALESFPTLVVGENV